MKQTVSFASLREFLNGLGCRFHSEPDSWVSFKHPTSRALIVLRFYRDEETVSPTDLAIARRVLDEFGVLTGGAFDEALRERALAS